MRLADRIANWTNRGPILSSRSYGGASFAVVLLAILATASLISAAALGQANAWLNGPNANTISVSFAESGGAQGQARFSRLVRKLIATDGVLAFRRNRGARGDDAVTLVDVYMDPGAKGREEAAAEIAAVLPGAEIEDPYSGAGSFAGWIGPATWSAVLAALVLLLWLGSAISSLARRMIASHAVEVDVVQMMGASRVQVSRLLERRVVRLLLIAGGLGAVLTTFLFVLVRTRSSVALAEALNLVATIGVGVALTPLLLVVVGKLVTRLAVLRALR